MMKIIQTGFREEYRCKVCEGYIISRVNQNLQLELFCQSCGRIVKDNIKIEYGDSTNG